jgi:uridine phosphorylase
MKKTELITNPDGSVFHLNLRPGDVAEKILIVGDPGRVDMLGQLLKEKRVVRENREFKTVTGTYDQGEVTIISSGIGTDNIDILINEIDALFNIDLLSGEIKDDLTQLTFIRLGTSGALRGDIDAGSVVLTETAVGFDGLLHFYEGYDWVLDTALSDALAFHLEWPDTLSYPYAVNANGELLEMLGNLGYKKGITISAPGFYAPQGRKLRLGTFDDEINKKLADFDFGGRTISNYEMESSAIYGLSKLLNHKAATVCAVIGNRVTGEFLNDYKPLVREVATKILSII